MTRLFLDRARAWTALFVGLTVVGMSPTTALAGASLPTPRVDAWSHTVRFRGPARVSGHISGAQPGDHIALERKASAGWVTRKAIELGAGGRFTIRMDHVRRTARYRLEWRASGTSDHRAGGIFEIKARPKLTLRAAPRDVMKGNDLHLAGHLYPAVPGRKVFVSRRVAGRWRFMKAARAGDGSFSVGIRGRAVGHHAVRVRFGGDGDNVRATERGAYNVYDPDRATWYGPGFYGHRTACGKTLHEDTLGVANRTLPCGTKVSILYRGRTITVPVIDRGPYSSADWDLTTRTAQRLRFEGSKTIGVRH
jgi:hypothetical protein